VGRRVHPVGGKVVLITGAAHGIGAESARRLAARGARLALVDVDGPALDAVADECRGAWRARADVTDDAALRTAVAAAVTELGGIDVAVVNAGVAAPGLLRFAPPTAFEETIAVNLLGAWRTLDAALPHLVARRGYALCVASVAAVAHVPALAAYSASKAGLEALSDALRLEVAHLGVDVGIAYFSWIDTAMVGGPSARGPAGRNRLAVPPLHRVYPVADAALAVQQAVEHRRRAVYQPRWLRAALPARGLLPLALERLLASAVERMDAAAARAASAGTVPAAAGESDGSSADAR
jgi:NAD(P)-dependent dehydrogenase (short-subunit alcohol dehydrogenase family)